MHSALSLAIQKKLKFADFVSVENSFSFSHSFQVFITPKKLALPNSIEQASQLSLILEIIFKQSAYLKKIFRPGVTAKPKLTLAKFRRSQVVSLIVFIRTKFAFPLLAASKRAPCLFFICKDVELFLSGSSALEISADYFRFAFIPERKKVPYFSFFLSRLLF